MIFLDKFAVLKKLSPPAQCGAKLQKRTNEATLCCRILAIAAGRRISEKNAAFSAVDHNGPRHDV
jgi:hypothetical protein